MYNHHQIHLLFYQPAYISPSYVQGLYERFYQVSCRNQFLKGWHLTDCSNFKGLFSLSLSLFVSHLDYQVFFQNKHLETTPQTGLEKDLIVSTSLYIPLLHSAQCYLFICQFPFYTMQLPKFRGSGFCFLLISSASSAKSSTD